MTEPPISLENDKANFQLRITWRDSQEFVLPNKRVREACGCARCVDEMTGRPLLDPATVPEKISIEGMKLVGAYAVKISWSDGHDTGLFTWERLRKLCDR
ncbi:MAG: DUF971 domain-containing protein [Pirellulales bacterium]